MDQREFVILVDEHDNQIGLEEKLKAHQLGLLHRAFSVFLFRKKNNSIELLLQKRAKSKYHCAGLWANTCCSHPREGEDVVQAANRRLQEEMGIQVDELIKVGAFTYLAKFKNGLTEHEIDHVLIGKFDAPEIIFNPKEVSTVKWISLGDVKTEFMTKPNLFTPWFAKALDVIPKQEIERLFE